MRAPVKLNRHGWPALLGTHRLVRDDPRRLVRAGQLSAATFSASASVLKLGTTFRTSAPGRHARTDAVLRELVPRTRVVVLDAGAADGSTSLDLMAILGSAMERYFVTDATLEVFHGVDAGGVSFFRDVEGHGLLRVSDRWVVYPDVRGAARPLAWLARHLLAGERRVTTWEPVSLLQPELTRLARVDPRVVVRRYDLFTPWRGPRPTLTKLANVLNRAYFSEHAILHALRLQIDALAEGGLLVLVENRGARELGSIYRKAGSRAQLEACVGGGCEIADLVAQASASPIAARGVHCPARGGHAGTE